MKQASASVPTGRRTIARHARRRQARRGGGPRLGAEVDIVQTPVGKQLRAVRWHGGDEGLEQLQNLPGLMWLDLEGTKVTDAALAKVGLLTQLEGLKLGHTQITDRGIAYLRTLRALEGLSLPGTKITAAGLEHLAPLAKLRMLNLASTKIGDAGLEKLNRQRQLDELNISHAEITDKGLAHLKPLGADCARCNWPTMISPMSDWPSYAIRRRSKPCRSAIQKSAIPA